MEAMSSVEVLPPQLAVELARYFSDKELKATISYDGLRKNVPSLSGMRRADLQKIAQYLVEHGVLRRDPSGYHFTGDIQGLNIAQHMPASVQRDGRNDQTLERDTRNVLYSNPSPDAAYELFDPNSNIFRALVVGETRYNHERNIFFSPQVKVLTPTGKVKTGIVSSYGYRRRTKIIRTVANKMSLGQYVLVRMAGQTPYGVWIFEPLVSIVPEDGVSFRGRRLETVFSSDRILDLPIISLGNYNRQQGVGFEERVSFVKPVFVESGAGELWKIVPEMKIIDDSESRYLAQIPL